MNSLYTYIHTTKKINMHEKCMLVINKNEIIFKKIKINFTLKNNFSNKVMFYTNLILLEKLCGQKLQFVYSTEHNQNFNIRKGTKIGCTLTLRNKKIEMFLFLLLTYSLRKLNIFQSLSFSKQSLMKLQNRVTSHMYFSLKKILFFLTLSSHIDWDQFSYIYDESIYGVDLQFQTNYINPYINRLLLSHYGLLII